MRRENGEMVDVCGGEEIEEGWRGYSRGLVCGWEKMRGGNSWMMRERESEGITKLQTSLNLKV